jgi:hypothetical protein
MSTSKKPRLLPGEYLPAKDVAYAGNHRGHHAGTYTVELGAEYRDKDYRQIYLRHVKVNGKPLTIYAMIHEKSGPDRKIERDEGVLHDRAIYLYTDRVLEPKRVAAEKAEEQRLFAEALDSPDTWTVHVGRGQASIEPLGIRFNLPSTTDENDRSHDAERARRTAIMERLVALAKQHGL